MSLDDLLNLHQTNAKILCVIMKAIFDKQNEQTVCISLPFNSTPTKLENGDSNPCLSKVIMRTTCYQSTP